MTNTSRPRTRAQAAILAAIMLGTAACGGQTSGDQTASTTGPASNEPQPLFADEFNEDGPLDWDVWQPILEKRHESRQTDREENVRVEDGNLVIEAHKESFEDAEYTSAMIQTRQSFHYGRFEARMKLPDGEGTWPAFWLVNDDKWPDHGEIDVMEHFARKTATEGEPQSMGYVESNLHSTPPAEVEALTDWGRVNATKIDVTEWHTYAVEWAEGEISFFIDDEQTVVHERPAEDSDETWPFDEYSEVIAFDMFLGAYAGDIDASALPQQLLVDWVRVWPLSEAEADAARAD